MHKQTLSIEIEIRHNLFLELAFQSDEPTKLLETVTACNKYKSPTNPLALIPIFEEIAKNRGGNFKGKVHGSIFNFHRWVLKLGIKLYSFIYKQWPLDKYMETTGVVKTND